MYYITTCAKTEYIVVTNEVIHTDVVPKRQM